MNLKTYRAKSMAECLTEVKNDLGSDAVILRTRSYRVGGMMGLGGRPMVEITASNDPVPNTFRPAPRKPAMPARAAAATPTSSRESAVVVEQQEPRSDPADRARAQHSGVRRGGEPIVAVRSEAVGTLDRFPGSVATIEHETSARGPRSLTTPVAFRPSTGLAEDALQEELASIKRMVGQVLRVSRQSAGAAVVEQGGMPGPLFEIFRVLTDHGLEPELIDRVLGETRDELGSEELNSRSILEAVATRRLASLIPVARGDSLFSREPSAAGPVVVAMVGPTGVGKTTTLAKLAATLKLRHQRRVGLITCDTYRIAAVEQLRVYADIIGLELKVAMSPQEAGRHKRSLEACDVVLVDTAGRSPHDDRRLEELREFIDVLSPDETHLVLSLASAEGVMARAGERFAGLRPDRLLMTKLDETVSFGPMVNLARSLSLPIGFVTTGQEVPDHFERADAERLAGVMLRGGGVW